MNTIKGPGIFLAQFLRDEEPYNSLDGLSKWVADLGYKGIQLPTWDKRIIDLNLAAESKSYCNELKDKINSYGLVITELASHLQGQVIAMHPAYEVAFQPFYPDGLKDKERTKWAQDQLTKSVLASANLGLKCIPVLSGGFAWHMFYPWPQRPEGLIEEAFGELAKRWLPRGDGANEHGMTFGFELHPGSDLYDGATFDQFLSTVNEHPAACINYDPSHFLLQQLDYLQFIQIYGERIKAFHVKDAEFNPNGRVGVYGGYQPWGKRAGRFRSIGDGQVDFKRVFTLLSEAGFDGWAVLEWEGIVKCSEQGAREGAPFISNHIIQTTDVAFDDFASGKSNKELNRKILGLD